MCHIPSQIVSDHTVDVAFCLEQVKCTDMCMLTSDRIRLLLNIYGCIINSAKLSQKKVLVNSVLGFHGNLCHLAFIYSTLSIIKDIGKQ